MAINNVIICGLGALGLTYASKLKNNCCLKILADSERIEKYKKNTPIFNGEEIFLDYIAPDDKFKADLIIISTKSTGLNSALEYIKNFVYKNTIIISLINGISSEEKIASKYPQATVLRSYFIGHSAMRGVNDNGDISFSQDGIGKIIFEKNDILEEFFIETNIDYEVSNNIEYSLWLKLGVNIILNQLSAIYKLNVGDLRKKSNFIEQANNLLSEVKKVAEANKIRGLENYEKEVLDATFLIADDGITSMYQDIITKRRTEIEIFSGEIIKLGKKYGIETPHNKDIYNKIKDIEKDF